MEQQGRSLILEGTDVAAVALRQYKCNVYCQVLNQRGEGVIRECVHSDGIWATANSPTFRAKIHSPLAAVSFDEGREVRVFCVSDDNYLQEWCHSAEPDSDYIQEYSLMSDFTWAKNVVLPGAIRGASLAAVCWKSPNLHLRVYYQAPDMTIREHCWDDHWYAGGFRTPEMLRNPSLAAVAWYYAGAQLRVYCQEPSRRIAAYKFSEATATWTPDGTVVDNSQRESKFSVVEWNIGDSVRFYYQADDNTIKEQCQDGGRAWFPGVFVAS
ncbi:fucose-specific lectin [Xylaria sp. CBS 124048]|nr:fucose-specific lectin [Xylaria sp. CBS 124048]